MIILWVSGEMLQSGYVGRISQSVYILQCCTYNLQLCTAHRTRDIPLNYIATDRKSTRLNSSHALTSRMPSSA